MIKILVLVCTGAAMFCLVLWSIAENIKNKRMMRERDKAVERMLENLKRVDPDDEWGGPEDG